MGILSAGSLSGISNLTWCGAVTGTVIAGNGREATFNIGADSPRRYVFVCGVFYRTASATPVISNMLINGAAATSFGQAVNGSTTTPWSAASFAFGAYVPAGATCTVSATSSNTTTGGRFNVYTMLGSGITSHDIVRQETTGTAGVPFNINVVKSGIVCASAFSGNNTTPFAWTGMTSNDDANLTTVRCSAAHDIIAATAVKSITAGTIGLRGTVAVSLKAA